MALFSATLVKNVRHPRLASPTHGALPGSSFARRPESGASRHLPPLRGLRHSVAAHCQRARRSRHRSGLPRHPEPSGVLHSTENSPRSEGPPLSPPISSLTAIDLRQPQRPSFVWIPCPPADLLRGWCSLRLERLLSLRLCSDRLLMRLNLTFLGDTALVPQTPAVPTLLSLSCFFPHNIQPL